MTSGAAETPVRPESTLACRPSWLVLHAVCLALTGFFWLFDEAAYHRAKAVYLSPEPMNGELHQLILSLAMYGQALGIVTALVLMVVFDVRKRGRIVVLGAMLLATGVCSSTLKAVIGRERPPTCDGKTVVHGLGSTLTATRNHSFPSGHTSTAFALSYGLSRFYPAAGPFVWPLAAGVAFNRVLTLRHFPSDVIAGAWLGWVIAAGVCRLGWLWRLAAIVSKILTPKRRMRSMRWKHLIGPEQLRTALASPILLVLVSVAIHWAGNGAIPLWDRDEPRFATATREMMARGDWIVPTFNGELRPDKPILIYWLMGIAYQVFGDNPFGARFFSGLAGSLACLLVFFVGRAMFDRRVGLLGAWMLALSPMLIVESKLATADALLFFCVVATFWSLWRLYAHSGGLGTALLFWASLSAGILAKGPVAVAVPAVSLATFCLLRGEWSWLQTLRWKWGLLLLLALVLPWTVAVYWATGGEFLEVALGHHVLRRSLQPLEGHKGFIGYYVLTLFGLMAPWAWLLPWSVRQHWQRWRSDSRIAFLVAWAVGTLLLFELVKTKLVHYYLPAYPALALLIASALVGKFGTASLGWRQLDITALARALMIVGTCVAVGVVALTPLMLPADMAVATTIVGLVLGLGMLLTGMLVRQRRCYRAFVVQAGTMAVAMLVAGHGLTPILGQHRLIVQVARHLESGAQSAPVALWLYRDPSLIYNCRRSLPIVDPIQIEPIFRDSLAFALRHGRFLCPMTPDQLEFMSKDPSLDLKVAKTVRGWDLNGMKERQVHLVSIGTSENVAELLRIQDGLREQTPGTPRLLLPLKRFSAETADARKLYSPASVRLATRPQRFD